MECKFTVGQKIVCITPGWKHFGNGDAPKTARLPHKDEICQIANMVPVFGVILLKLKGFEENIFDHRGFRPLNDLPKEADTDISIFYPALRVAGPRGAPKSEPANTPSKEDALKIDR